MLGIFLVSFSCSISDFGVGGMPPCNLLLSFKKKRKKNLKSFLFRTICHTSFTMIHEVKRVWAFRVRFEKEGLTLCHSENYIMKRRKNLFLAFFQTYLFCFPSDQNKNKNYYIVPMQDCKAKHIQSLRIDYSSVVYFTKPCKTKQ